LNAFFLGPQLAIDFHLRNRLVITIGR
jgi:hypothetical protein